MLLILVGLGVWAGYSIGVSATPLHVAADPATATPIAALFDPHGETFVDAPNFNSLAYAPSGPYAPALSTGAGGSATGRAGADTADASDPGCPATMTGIQNICHVIIIMMENQSFDRLFGSFHNALGTPVDGIPLDANGTPLPCLPDPRQSEQPAGVILSCERPYHVPYTPLPANPPVPAATTAAAYQQQQNLNDNPHDAWPALTDIAGVPPTVGLTPGSIPTPMTGFLAAAWSWCLTPNIYTGYYEYQNKACNTPTPGTLTATATPFPPGYPTPTLVPFDVMRYLDGNDLPYYWYFASRYVVQDHLFEPVKSYSLPAHLYLVSNWSASCPLVDPTTTAVVSGTPTVCQNQPSTPPAIINQPSVVPTGQYYPNYAWTDITYLLDHRQVNALGVPVAQGTPGTPAPVTWGYYRADNTQPDCPGYGADATPHPYSCNPDMQPYSGTVEYWNPLQFFTTVHFDGTPGPGTPTPLPNNQGQLGNIHAMQDYFTEVHNEQLPQVSWIVPPIDNSDHPPFSLDYGQLFVTSIISYTAYQNPVQWAHTAIFLAWDDWGGFYDHEPPPQIGQDQNGYGIRVPGVVISPYAKHCAVDSQPMSFDAYDKFIEDDFLAGQRLDPATDGRPDPRGTAQPVPRETALPTGSDLVNDFTFSRTGFSDNLEPPPAYATPDASWCSG